MRIILRTVLPFVAGLAIAGPASAQSEQDFIDAFSGQWYLFDLAMRDNSDACAIRLSPDRTGERLPVTTSGCVAPLKTLDTWAIDNGRIILSAGTDQVAVMGGNQFRVTGELTDTDTSLVIERAEGDGNSARIAAALRKHKCYYVGFTQSCAEPDDLRLPVIDAESGFTTVETLANLNARAQPRRDAPTLGNIAQGTKVRLNQCLTASDGPWCRARIGDTVVWLAMTALRQDEWPIVTYRISEPTD